MSRYFAVTCKQGHHGAHRYEPITFAIIADDALCACDIARDMPSVKHDQPVIKCMEISAHTYYSMRRQSAYERGSFRFYEVSE